MPYINPKRTIPYERSFACCPKSKEWSKKNTVSPRDVPKASNIKCYFDCEICKHTYEMRLRYSYEGAACHYCTNQKLCNNVDCITCFEKSFASHMKSREWSKKNSLLPRDVFKGSKKKYFFDCKTCKHTYKAALGNLSVGTKCNYCTNKKLCDKVDCDICYQKSFASYPKSKEWSEKNAVTPRDVFKNSHVKYLFDCEICNHTYDITLNNISNGVICGYCQNQKLCGNINCMDCFNKSFASNTRSVEWSNKNNDLPINVFKNSSITYLFDCNKCKHTYKTVPVSISAGSKCSFCANVSLCGKPECTFCFEKSFQSDYRSEFWSDKNDEKPINVFKHSEKKYMFDCKSCNRTYISTLANITGGNTWCSCTKNKTEAKLFKFLDSECKLDVKSQKKFDWCKNKNHLRFDYYIPKYNLIIELDGPQHFKQVSNWVSPKKTQKRDKYKMDLANKNGYTVIRIVQEDVWKDINDWKTKLSSAIKQYNEPINIFIGDVYSNEYIEML